MRIKKKSSEFLFCNFSFFLKFVATMESNAVVSKLQSAIANFRREKDAAQRNRDLAIERLKASTMTFESEQAKTASLQSRLDDINRKIAAGNGQEIAQKRGENDRLEREVSA